MATINSFPIQTRKTSELSLGTTLPTGAQLLYWSGILGENVARIAATPLVNDLLQLLTAPAESLAADRSITAADRFANVFNPGATARTVTVAAGLSVFIHNVGTATAALTVHGVELKPGESALVLSDGSTAHTVAKLAAAGGGGGTGFLTITKTDDTNANHYYYGGTDAAGEWKINRYDKTTLARTSATEANNAAYGTLDSAWLDRLLLTYA